MIASAPDGTVCSIGISPIRGSSKHETTPLNTRRKTSRKDQAIDVHTTCSTPNRNQSPKPRVAFNSPSDTFLCSQDHRPDVIWDYTSPKLPKGSSKRDIKITVDEFLKSLSHTQAPECNTQTSQYIKLLEKWMAKQNTPVCVKKPVRAVKRDHKMRSRRVFEEIKQFMESMQQKPEDNTVEHDGKESTEESSKQKSDNLSTSLDKKCFLEGDSKENDSIDELWGEADNSFIVKATQHLDVSCFKYEAESKNLDVVSTIPETLAQTSSEPKTSNNVAEQSTDNLLNKAILDSDYKAQMLLSQIMSCDWDSDSDNGDLENGFIMGDEDLSLIPDEVLCGADSKCDKKLETKEEQSTVVRTCDTGTTSDTFKFQKSVDSKKNHSSSTNRSPEITFGCYESNRVSSETENISEVELFNNFEDELILSNPEVLSWIDEVENKSSQSQRCTDEEIKRKKDEAIQRRKKNLSTRKS